MAIQLVTTVLDTSLFTQVIRLAEGSVPKRITESGGNLVLESYSDPSVTTGAGFRVWLRTSAESASRLRAQWYLGRATVASTEYYGYAQIIEEVEEQEDYLPGYFYGPWSDTSAYDVGDYVRANNGLYVCRVSLPPNRGGGRDEPGGGGAWAANWDLVLDATVGDNTITNTKLVDMAGDTIKGRVTTSGDPQDLTPTQVRTMINVEDGATADENLASANQTLIANRTIDDGNNGYLFFVDLEDTGKKSQILMNPANPNILAQANDGAGNIGAYTVGSANINLQFTGTCDLRINNDPGTDGQVLTSTGTGTAPAWETPAEGGNFGEWEFTHFYSANANANGPYNAAATLGATSGSAGVAAIYTRPGVITIRSATVVDSAYSWATASRDRIVNIAGLAWCGVFRLPTATGRQVKMGFYDDQFDFDGSSDVDGAYLQIDASNVATPTCKSNSTSTTGSTFAMSDDTWYYVDIWFETTSSVRFRVRSLDDATSHLDVDITTNIPTGTARRFGAGIVSGDGSLTAQDCLYLDYMGHGMHPYSDGRRFVST